VAAYRRRMKSESAAASLSGDVKLDGKRQKLDELKIDLEIAEVRRKISEAGTPWWRNARSVAGLTAIIGAVAPVTVGAQAWVQKDRELAQTTRLKEMELRQAEAAQLHQFNERFFDSVVRDPRTAQLALRFIKATATEPAMRLWATDELKLVDTRVDLIDRRPALYREAIQTIANLAKSDAPGQPSDDLKRFWDLYKTELVPVESAAIEGFMVEAGRILTDCGDAHKASTCNRARLQTLVYDMEHQARSEQQESPPAKASSAQ
jgi:hypothetical protein